MLHEHAVNEVLLGDALREEDAESAVAHYSSAVASLRQTSSAMPKDGLTWRVFTQALERTARLTELLRGEGAAGPYWQELCKAFDQRQRTFGLAEEETADWLEACQKGGTNPQGAGWRDRWRRRSRSAHRGVGRARVGPQSGLRSPQRWPSGSPNRVGGRDPMQRLSSAPALPRRADSFCREQLTETPGAAGHASKGPIRLGLLLPRQTSRIGGLHGANVF